MASLEYTARAAVRAARCGDLGVLRRQYERGVWWDSSLCDIAAEGGHLACLWYLHEHGCLWDELTCLKAAENGHLECLRYAHEHGCLWNEGTCYYACYRREWECLRYAIAHGCPHDKEDVRYLVRHYLLPKWRAHVRVVRPVALYWLERAMVKACASEGAARKRDREAFETDFGA